MIEKKKHSKHYSRCCAVQAIYQWHHTQDSMEEIITQFAASELLKQGDRKYFKKLVGEIIALQPSLDELFIPYLDRKMEALTPVELAILRVAVFELAHCLEIPYKVVINEALEIAKAYGAEQSHKYINAILDSVAVQVRTTENVGGKA